MVKIAAAICTYNRYDILKKSIDSLINQSLDNDQYEVWVIDNTPEANEGLGKQLSLKYRHVPNLHYHFEKTPGLSNARNVAIRKAQSEYIAFLDDDAIASKYWLEKIITGFESFENVGVVGGQIKPIWQITRPRWLSDALVGNLSIVDWGGALRVANEKEWFAGANISFRRNLLLECNGFMTNLGRIGNSYALMSNEEIKVLEFAKKNGYLAVYQPEATVEHLIEEKRLKRAWFRRRVAWQAISNFVMTEDIRDNELREQLRNVRSYLSSLPPLSRNIQGFFYETDDPEMFCNQLSAIYNFTHLTIAGYEGMENE